MRRGPQSFRSSSVPTISLKAMPTAPCTIRTATLYRKKYTGKYAYRVVAGGIGHNLPQGRRRRLLQAVIDVDTFFIVLSCPVPSPDRERGCANAVWPPCPRKILR